MTVNAKNQIVDPGFSYDAAGNMMSDGLSTYTFGAENRLKTAGGVTYSYDGDGKRLMKSNGTIYWYGTGSDPLLETDLAGNFKFQHYYFNGLRVARREANNWVDHYALDHLGNARWVYGNNGASDVSDFYPFGGERPVQSDAGNRYKFTGKERDTESGLDYFGARYNSSNMGRFMTPDPVVITTERLYDPQQLNAYAYVRNNPLRFVDPTGKILTVSGDANAAKEDLCTIAGDACDRITVDQKTGTVSFKTEGLDLSKNEGAALINDLVTSQSHFDFSVGATVETAGGTIRVDHVVNLDNNYDQRYDIRKPPGKLKKATEDSVTFHELAEAYSKVDHSKQYSEAHQEAIQREQKLRDQRPYLKEHNPGSGPGDRIIIKR